MLAVLLESRARPSRHTGGAALSAAVHLTIIAAATAATAHGRMAAASPIEVVKVAFIAPPPPSKPSEHARALVVTMAPPHLNATPIAVRHVDIPTVVPVGIPTADYTRALSTDSIVLGSGTASGHPSTGLVLDLDDQRSAGELRGSELLMRIITPARPRYPEPLRQAGVDGRVLVRFVVDTLGNVSMGSVQIVESTHELFTQAVRDALKAFRFKATVVQGRKVESLAEMPFEFTIRK